MAETAEPLRLGSTRRPQLLGTHSGIETRKAKMYPKLQPKPSTTDKHAHSMPGFVACLCNATDFRGKQVSERNTQLNTRQRLL